jgi:hypothetical protein
MFQRGIAPNGVEDIIKEGEVIASYPNDAPFPSALVLGFDEGRPVHVVVTKGTHRSKPHEFAIVGAAPAVKCQGQQRSPPDTDTSRLEYS